MPVLQLLRCLQLRTLTRIAHHSMHSGIFLSAENCFRRFVKLQMCSRAREWKKETELLSTCQYAHWLLHPCWPVQGLVQSTGTKHELYKTMQYHLHEALAIVHGARGNNFCSNIMQCAVLKVCLGERGPKDTATQGKDYWRSVYS